MEDNNVVYSRVFLWMFVGLLVTFVTGYVIANDLNLVWDLVIGKGFGLWPYIIIQFGIVIGMGLLIKKMNALTAKILFLVYSFVTGVTFSIIFVVYNIESIITVFGVTSVLFLIFAIYGHRTKKDVTKIGTMAFMALLGAIIVGIINAIFLNNTALDTVISIVSIVAFIGFIIYDMKKMKILVEELGEEKG